MESVPSPSAPRGFRVRRSVSLGRHPLLAVFPNLDELETAVRWEPDAATRRERIDATSVEIVDQDLWMYVAPHAPPRSRVRRWSPVVTPEDCVVIGRSHLSESPDLTLFLDIFHELCHLRQRRHGAELFDRPEPYVERPTEVEAYRFVIEEGRRFGVPVEVLREYLEVEWISEAEHRTLVRAVGLPTAP